MFPTLRLLSRTTYRGAAGSGPGRSGKTAARSSPASRKSALVTDAATAANWFKRAQRGLYDGAQLQSGHSIPNSRHKTKRLFKPNVQRKTLWSDILNTKIRLRVTTRGLRSIEKKGGLDYYIADTSDVKLGQLGRRLRTKMGVQVEKMQAAQSRLLKPASEGVMGHNHEQRPRVATIKTRKELEGAKQVDSTAQALEAMDIGGAKAANLASR